MKKVTVRKTDAYPALRKQVEQTLLAGQRPDVFQNLKEVGAPITSCP